MASHHHIRRQRWQLMAADQARAFELRQLIRHELDTLNRVFEHALDAAEPADVVLHIPQLHVHLKIGHEGELADQLGRALATQLAAVKADGADSVVHMQPASGQRRQSLLHFLRHGRVGWHAMTTDAPVTKDQLADELITWLDGPADVWEVLQQAVPEDLAQATAVFLRLLNLLPTAYQGKLIRLASAHANEGQHAAHAETMTALRAYAERKRDGYLARYQPALRMAVLAARQPVSVAAMQAHLVTSFGHESIARFSLDTVFRHASSGSPAPAGEDSSRALPAQPSRPEKTSTAPGNASVRSTPDSRAGTAPTPQPQAAPRIETASVMAYLPDKAQDSQPGLRVYAGGLILLHPYLSRFLNACHIPHEGEFIAQHSLPRAAALLHFLATGREEIHEFELDLVKLLLGHLPETPVPVAPGLLSLEDRQEGEALLGAVIGHWQALRSTSIDGFRLSFLQRQGLLYDNGSHWLLHIESEAFDVLLSQLPWSISLIKLPWMTKPIFIDWPTH